ncbi:NAD(P)/FAD-dependent oxidoreductase [Candidatus Saccharibacteria bacterium]|nr:NAD(P)/FAD-dependent oxidoreductase [Candidatus Saccharibacteria bacterium]
MGKKFDFEYIVIGSGPAGTSAALALAKARKKVAIVEGENFGGANLNTRDVPYLAGLKFSHLYYDATHASKCGISSMNLHFNFPTAAGHQAEIVKNVGGGDASEFEKAGITCISGWANFIDSNTIAVGEREYSATKFIIATGSKLSVGNIAGTDFVNFLTPEAALTSRRLPRAICIVGGGATGCEIAEYYAKLGVKTALIERSSRLLPREDEEVGKVIREYFENELGIVVLTNARVAALEKDATSKRVVFTKDNREKMVRVDTIVLATGSEPSVDLGLENADVHYKKSGILVDKNFQTSAKNIYAIGDCLGGESSTDIAALQGKYLASTLIYRVKTPISYSGIIRAVNTCPEVATVGYNEDDLIRRDKHCRKEVVYLPETNAAKIYECEKGFVKLLANKENRLIGAVIVAPNAVVMAHELALAVRNRISIVDLAWMPHRANSFSEAIQIAATRLASRKK